MLTLAGTTGCDLQRHSSLVDDSNDLDYPTLVLSDVPAMRIGGDDERKEYQLGLTIGALRLSDGRVVVADGMTRELRYYDPQGQHLRTVGGTGAGPGEFRRLQSLRRMQSDTVVAWDASQRRLSVFTPDGNLAYSVTNPGWATVLAELQKRYPYHFLVPARVHQFDGERIVIQLSAEPNVALIRGTQVVQVTIPVLVVNRNGEAWKELGMFAGTEFFVQEGVGGVFPLGETQRVAAADDVVYAGSTRDTAIHILSPKTGEILGSITLPWARRATSANDIEVSRRRLVERMRPQLQPRMVRYADAIPWTDSLPMFSDLLIGADQRVWVQLYRAPSDDSQEWRVFEPSGAISAAFTMDTSFRLLDAGAKYAIVQSDDESGVEEIRVHDLEAAPSGR